MELKFNWERKIAHVLYVYVCNLFHSAWIFHQTSSYPIHKVTVDIYDFCLTCVWMIPCIQHWLRESYLYSGSGVQLSVLISIAQWSELALFITQCSRSCFICISFALNSERIQELKNMPRHSESIVELSWMFCIDLLRLLPLKHLNSPNQINMQNRRLPNDKTFI